MAAFTKLKSGSWRVQVRRKSRYISETFLRRENARRWTTDAERQVDRDEAATASRTVRLNTFGDLVHLPSSTRKKLARRPVGRRMQP